jgi:hypothetical protein
MSPQVRVLRAALWRSLSSEGVPLRCGLQTWGLLCEVCVVLCSGRGRDTVSLVTRGNSVFVAANRVLKRGQSRNDVVFRKTSCCEARPHLPDKKDKAGRKRVTWLPLVCLTLVSGCWMPGLGQYMTCSRAQSAVVRHASSAMRGPSAMSANMAFARHARTHGSVPQGPVRDRVGRVSSVRI